MSEWIRCFCRQQFSAPDPKGYAGVRIRCYEDDDNIKWEPVLMIVDVYGIRTFWDLQQNQDKHKDEEWQEKMMQLEMRVSQIPEYREISFFHHIILKKR